MDAKFDTREYVRSRKAYIVFCAVDYYITIAVTDTFLAKILSDIGVSDILTGIISSFISLAFLFEIFVVLFAHRIRNGKRLVTVLWTASALLFSTLYLVPGISIGVGGKTALALVLIVVASFCRYFSTPLLFKQANSFVAPEKRGEYSASKEIFSLWTGILFTLAAGFLIDYFELGGRLGTGFHVIAALMFTFSLILFLCLCMIGDGKQAADGKVEAAAGKQAADGKQAVGERHEADGKQTVDENAASGERHEADGKQAVGEAAHQDSFLQVCRKLAGNRNFRHVIWMTCLWNVALYMTMGYLGIYKIKELGFTVGTVQVITIAASMARLLMSKPFGRYTDAHTFARGIKAALVIAAIAFCICGFVAPGSRWLIVVFTVLYSVSQAGLVQNFSNIIYSYVDRAYIVQALAIKESIGGLCGMASSLVGGAILGYVQDGGNRLFGIPVYGQQVLAFITFTLILVLIGYIHCVVEKQAVMRQ